MSDTRPTGGAGGGDRDDSPDDAELRAVVEDLTTTLQEVQRELERRQERERRDRRGLFGLPRPPSGRELLRFADEFAIPAAITILEANVTLLKQFRRAIRTAEGGREARDRTRAAGEEAVDVGQDLLERVGDGLRDLRAAIEGDTVPEDAAGRELLAEVRDLQAEIEDRVDDAERRRDRSRRRREAADRGESRSRGRQRDGRERTNGDARAGGDDRDASDDEDARIDVDAELESLRDQYRDEGDDDEDTDD